MISIKSYHKHYHPDEYNGVCVVRRKNESVESLIKRFKKKYSKSGISKEVRDKMFHEKPSDKRRRKKMQSIRAIKREEEKAEQNRLKLQKIKLKKQKQMKKKGAKQNDSSNKRQSRSNNDDQRENKKRDNNS